MQVKILEVRDRATFIPVMAIKMQIDPGEYEEAENEIYLLRRAGYDRESLLKGDFVMLTHATGGAIASIDPYGWGGRTYPVAHKYITENFDFLPHGAIVDVEYILGETHAPKQSERFNDIVKEIEAKGG